MGVFGKTVKRDRKSSLLVREGESERSDFLDIERIDWSIDWGVMPTGSRIVDCWFRL